MDRSPRISLPAAFDRDAAQTAWLRALPPEVRETLLRPRDIARLLDWSEQFIEHGSPEALAELDAEIYRLATAIQQRLGTDAALRFLRDDLACALSVWGRPANEHGETVARIIGRASDAVWKAHTDALQATIQQQEREAFQKELMLAKRIQDRLLPRSIPTIPGFDIAGRVLQAAEVGGDYWSCKNYAEDDIVTLKLADVTGHGIAAATLVAAVKFISGGYYRGAKTAAQVMERTNNVLVRETPHEILVTMVYGWLYPHSKAMSVVNAGHSPVLHYQAATREFRRIEPTGVALGLMETRYAETRIQLEPGDIFFTCSDGVTEPFADGALGEVWVEQQVREGAGLGAAELVDRVLSEALKVYQVPKDDMSVLVVKRRE